MADAASSDRLDEALARLAESGALLETLAGRPLDDLVGSAPDDVDRAGEVAERLESSAVDVRQSAASLGARLAAAAGRRRAQLRFTPEGVASSLDRLAARTERSARRGWLAELAAAVAAPAPAAVELLLARPLGVGEAAAAELAELRARGPDAAQGGDVGLIAYLRARFADDIASRQDIRHDLLVAEVRAQLERGDQERAKAAAAEACAGAADGVLAAERAFLLARLGEREAATDAASRAASLDAQGVATQLAQAVVREQAGDYAEGDELYRQAFDAMDVAGVEAPERASLFVPSGMAHLRRGRRLETIGLLGSALGAFRDAVAAGVNGPGLYAEAPAYESVSRVLTRLGGDPSEIRTNAYEAGRRYYWLNQFDRAAPLLRTAAQAGDALPLAGFYLAASLAASAWSARTPSADEANALPDEPTTREAERLWEESITRLGLPPATDAWVYAVGARIADQLSYFQRDKAASTWTALLRTEKALAVDPRLGGAWGLASRFLRAFNLEALALEAADEASRLDPGDEESKNQRLALLSNAGRYAEALEVLDGLLGESPDSWFVGVRGWLRLHTGQVAEGVEDLTTALAGRWDPGWDLEVRSVGLVELGRLDEALDDLRQILAVDTDFGVQSARRRAHAHAVLGNQADALHELAQIRPDDPMIPTEELGVTRVVVAACGGDHHAAAEALEMTVNATRNLRSHGEAVDVWGATLTLLEFRGAVPASLDILRGALARFAEFTPLGDPSPDEELAEALASFPDEGSSSGAVLLAVCARREVVAGRELDAARTYERLVAGPFEPEATAALVAALRRALDNAVHDGDADVAAAIHNRLAVLGSSPYLSEELAVADAIHAGGLTERARETLLEAADKPSDTPGSYAATSLRLGEAQVLAGDLDAGLGSLKDALVAATAANDWYAAARVHARIATVLAAREETETAAEQLRAAVWNLAAAGLTNTATALAVQLREAATAMGLSDPIPPALTQAYELATGEAGSGLDVDPATQQVGVELR